MSNVHGWYPALCVVADFSPPAYWKMTTGAQFWWLLDRSQLSKDRFLTSPFAYSQIEAIWVFNKVMFGTEEISCDWDAMKLRLQAIPGICALPLEDIFILPATPPNLVLELSELTSDHQEFHDVDE